MTCWLYYIIVRQQLVCIGQAALQDARDRRDGVVRVVVISPFPGPLQASVDTVSEATRESAIEIYHEELGEEDFDGETVLL